MTKLTKTEQRLLAEAAKHGGRFSVTHGYERPYSRTYHFGRREIDAAIKLVQRGLVVREPSDMYDHNLYGKPGRGIIGRCHTSIFRVKDQ